MKGNIGLFRTKESFRILNIPVEVTRQCHVASSFHVKPLLRWIQVDRDFLFIGLEKDTAHIFFGNQSTIQKVDSIKLSLDEQCISFLKQIMEKAGPRLFFAGDKKLAEKIFSKLKYKNVFIFPIAPFFSDDNLAEICIAIRKILSREAKETLNKALLEFHYADEINLAKKNIFQISKAAIQGKVKKLIIADGINVFGKVDKKTGKLAIHPFDLNHEDDDVLDDLAQTVLALGGEVVIAPQEQIPKGRPILAILSYEGTDFNKNEDINNFEILKEKMI